MLWSGRGNEGEFVKVWVWWHVWEGFSRELLIGSSLLTGGQTAVRAAQIDVAFWDCCHTKLVIGASEKGSESAGKYHIPLSGSASHRNADLGNEIILSTFASEETFMCQTKETQAARTSSQKDHPEGKISVVQTIFEGLFELKTTVSRTFCKNLWSLFYHMDRISGIPPLTNNFPCPVSKPFHSPTSSLLSQKQHLTLHKWIQQNSICFCL